MVTAARLLAFTGPLIGGEPDMKRIQVYVVLPPRLLLLDIAGPLEVLRRANREQAHVRFDVHYVGPTPSVSTSIGLPVAAVEPLPAALPSGALVVIGGDVDEVMPSGPRDSEAAKLDKHNQAKIVEWLRQVVRPGNRVISICSGALIAAKAGLLDGYNCTTHYVCCQELAEMAPKARVHENRLYVLDGERYTSAGVTAGIDLMLHIVGQLTDESCVAAVARYLVVYLRRSGADPQLSPWLEGRNHIHPVVHKVQDAIARDPAKAWNLTGLARIAGASSRHLSRLFYEHAGMSVTDYKNRLRVTLAHELVSQTRLDMERIAERAGFGSTRQLRRAWQKLYGTTPKHARAAR
jgi:transcriptional regulator GlxA family with amidase domain